ncbi:S8 family serine peptidase [Streptomyces sp. NPDC006458]|uniref:S8 family serine peptidase n=1 Tax=Streptomyces sp. NPDC006458 TaxID=3154302 RepID=UPI00339DD6AD
MTTGPVGRAAAVVAAGIVLTLTPAPDGGAAEGTPASAAARPAATSAPAKAGPPAATSAPAPAHAAHTVTLVTGDRVTVTDLGHGRRTVTVRRPRGADGAVRTRTDEGRITVVPDEALPYLRAHTLDERLFDVSGLIRQGLGDDRAGELPLIVTYDRGARTAVPRGAERTRSLTSVRGAAVAADKGREFWRSFTRQDGIRAVWLDGRVRADMAESNAQIGTAAARAAGLTGRGVTVAVLDSGVDTGHPDLAGRVTASRSFVEGEDIEDRYGHGTHVASTLGGSGAASDGAEQGVAPGAALAVGKVLGDQGTGSESQIIAGMEWAAREVGADIVSMSLGTTEPSDGTDPMAQAVNTLTAETGALFVVSAGNTGAPSSIGSPGAADAALTVGAVDSADRAAWFTSAGPRLGDNALKPDLAAPGVDILAARSRLTPGSGPYTTLSGTSMAAPHVAGAAALLAERHPDWSGARLKDALMSTAKPLDASAYELGAGRVSVPDAVGSVVTATGGVDLGFLRWPYPANEPVTRTVTYANSSDHDVRLRLSATGGAAVLADSTLTVPAHGTAATTVTRDGDAAPIGATSGRIVASADDGTPLARTAFGLVKEDERYTLTVHVRDRAGDASAADLTVQRLTEGTDPFPARVGDSGTVRLRLAPGTYGLTSFLDVRGSGGADSLGLGFLAAPEVVLDRDREVTLDGRRLRELRAEVDRRTERRQLVMEYAREANGSRASGAVMVPVKYDSVFAAPTARVAQGLFEYRTVWRLGRPQLLVRGVADAVVQPGGTLPEGRRRLPLADAGAGPFTGVRGKAVLVRLTEGADPAELARAAQDAGVAALFVTDDRPGRLTAWWGADDGTDRPFPIATLDAADAARLRETAVVDLTGTRNTPYVYDLSQGHRGAIPDRDLTYRPGERELAVLDTSFHAVRPVRGGEFRYSLTDAFPLGLGFQESVDLPARRTDHVSTGPGQRWQESVTLADGALEQRGGAVRYRGGTHRDLAWFRPVWHPWLGTALDTDQRRRGGVLALDAPGWGDSGPDHTGVGDVWSEESGMRQDTGLYLDGEQVDRARGSAVHLWDAPADEHAYRLVTDTALDPGRWELAVRGHTEWTFRSAAADGDRETLLPLINLSFDLATDLAGEVPGGRRVPVGIGAAYVAGAEGTGTLGGPELEVSYDDGQTWREVALDRAGRGALGVPPDARYVSLRASARDDRGGSVRQEIIRAVGVR